MHIGMFSCTNTQDKTKSEVTEELSVSYGKQADLYHKTCIFV